MGKKYSSNKPNAKLMKKNIGGGIRIPAESFSFCSISYLFGLLTQN
jgi:hypothetical protein